LGDAGLFTLYLRDGWCNNPRAGYLDFKYASKVKFQIAWPCAKLNYHWMSTDGKAAQNHCDSDHLKRSTVIKLKVLALSSAICCVMIEGVYITMQLKKQRIEC
jgi:hypothetical protein